MVCLALVAEKRSVEKALGGSPGHPLSIVAHLEAKGVRVTGHPQAHRATGGRVDTVKEQADEDPPQEDGVCPYDIDAGCDGE